MKFLYRTAILTLLLIVSVTSANAQLSITATSNKICVGGVVSFTVTGNTGLCQDWYANDIWSNFGNGNTVSYQFNSSGNYWVKVTDYSDASCSSYIGESTFNVQVVDTSAGSSSHASIACPNSPVNFFTNSDATSYKWEFGDGQSSNNQSVDHEYTNLGAKNVKLILFRPCGNDTVNSVITIVDTIKPNINNWDIGLDRINDTLVCINSPVKLNWYGNSANYVDYRWYFADGDSSASENPYHSYGSIGYYSPYLVVTNGCLKKDTAVLQELIHVDNNVSVPPLYSHLAYTYDNPACENSNVRFYFNNWDHPSHQYTYTWSFGDGKTSSLQNPVHTYTNVGTYTPSLVVTNSCGNSDTLQMSSAIDIRNDIDPNVSAGSYSHDANGSGICPGTPVTFDFDSASFPSDYTWKWYFGDGDSSTLAEPTHTYTATGSYTPTIFVWNACNRTYTSNLSSISVYNSLYPSLNSVGRHFYPITPSDTFCVGDPAGFVIDDFSVPPGLSFAWHFGDGNTSAEEAPIHSYSTTGTYTVYVIATNTCGNSDTSYYSNDIVVLNTGGLKPYAGWFSVDRLNVCENDSVSFTPAFANYFKYLWQFDDGNTSQMVSPKHAYSTNGGYDPMMIVENSCGMRDTASYNTIQVSDVPTVDAGNNRTILSGAATMLVATVSGTLPSICTWNYQWSPSAGLDADNVRRPIAKPSVTTTYYVTVTNAGGSSCFASAVCSEIDSVTITVQNNLSGMIYRNNYNDTVKGGNVYLVQWDTTNQVQMPTVDTTAINSDGTYSFGYVNQGKYYLLADASTVLHPNASPTYYGDTVFWRGAQVYNHQTNTNALNISVKEYNGFGSGPGRIAGIVLEGDYKMMGPGDPVKGIDVGLVKKPSPGIVQMSFSDTSNTADSGKFEFNNLPTGSYELFVNLTGVPLHISFPTTTFSITANDTLFENVGVYLDSNLVSLVFDISGVYHPSTGEKGILVTSVYPNPAGNVLNLAFENNISGNSKSDRIQIKFLDVRGKEIEALSPFELYKGRSIVSLNTSNLTNGIYLLGLQTLNNEQAEGLKIISKVVIVK